jgi:hypothetical protein
MTAKTYPENYSLQQFCDDTGRNNLPGFTDAAILVKIKLLTFYLSNRIKFDNRL